MHVTGIYAALAALLVLLLAARVSLARRRSGVGIGAGGDHELGRRIRAHGNAVESLPIALLLLLLLDLGQTPPLWLHVFGVVLLVGRVLHAIGLSRSAGVSFGRMVGTVLTWGVILTMAVLLLWKAVMY
ncbi:MAG TPA: MAPEG family protein [Dokdonella sp.]